MEKINVKSISSLEKHFLGSEISCAEFNKASCLSGERFSYQIAVIGNEKWNLPKRFNISVKSDLGGRITIYEVGYVPVVMPAYNNMFDNRYITRRAALLPDILMETDGTVSVSGDKYRFLWVSVETAECSGVYEIEISFEEDGKICGKSRFELEVIDAVLPEQSLIFTQWLHCDCISSYYGMEPLSEKHWEYIEKYINTAVQNGVNMILTPIFTPPLDTKIGHERPTVQLVDVRYEGGTYHFGFEKLLRWIRMCRKSGIKYLEISHLFTQWGAKHVPKIEVEEAGKRIKKFGWQTDAESTEYMNFLAQLLPQLTSFLSKNWDKSKVYFHISDEPGLEHVERYGKLFMFVKEHISDFKLTDAISDYEFYEKGFCETPVSTIKTIDNFIEHGVKNIWGYYCCGEGTENLSNRFIAMPSYRNRIIGTQLYKFDIKGFLHWGYNFYYSQYSTKLLNPYVTNDGDGAFPAGDAFSVYPGINGPIPSVRLFVFFEAIQDMRAMKLLESFIGREKVVKMIDDCAGENITFKEYPSGAEYILKLREEINKIIKGG